MDHAKKLAEDHWEYVQQTLIAHGMAKNTVIMQAVEHHYKSAFIHGFKHGVDSTKKDHEPWLKVMV